MFDAVVFDLDDTLVVEEACARSSLREAAMAVEDVEPDEFVDLVLSTARSAWTAGPEYQTCVELGFASWEGLWSTFEGNDRRVDGLRRWAPQYREVVWRAVLEAKGQRDPGLAEAVSALYVAAQRAGHPLIEGATDAVRACAGRPVGLVTNGPSDIQRIKLDGAGLTDAFDAVVISGEVGTGKPSPEVFGHVLDRLGVQPARAAMVGDSWERDVIGALGAGMTAVWLAWGRPPPERLAGVVVVDRVAQVVELLA